ncbi:hypothetical protein ONS95_000291 [Cadophora gregata]|uniref:uncharacterized protein n=1 Tax=Cadophora gregata TaxID=51156 RepID=UPI0026DBB709|nr:uncharacterized protein ONS95_000291 [Cadophora gregata]KAK0128316.1 hypothetical protein ONS95_000291 [Cadophora gregata]
MQFLSAYLALIAATSIAALPLNINLGAYSPALVVGDGEISFGGEENAEALLSTLAGASAGVEGAAAGLQRAEKREEDSPVEKRDLAGFNAALNFATGALRTSPGVQLGTGEGGSGIGIKVEPGVDAGVAAPAARPATPAAPAAEKRDAPVSV